MSTDDDRQALINLGKTIVPSTFSAAAAALSSEDLMELLHAVWSAESNDITRQLTLFDKTKTMQWLVLSDDGFTPITCPTVQTIDGTSWVVGSMSDDLDVVHP